MKRFGVLCMLFSLMPISAHAVDASVNLSAEYTSEYVFRGLTFSGDAIQPAIETNFNNFTLGAWSSFAINDDQDVFTDQIDLYASVRWNLGDIVSTELGATLYHFPGSGGLFDIGDEDDDASTVELYGGLDFDVVFSPSLTAYYDIHLETITIEGSARYDISIFKDFIFRTSIRAGLVEADTGGLNYQYGRASAQIFYDVTENASFFAGGHYGLSSEDTFLDTSFDIEDPASLQDPEQSSSWFSIGVTTSF